MQEGRYLIEFETRADTLGPLTRRELLSLARAIEEYLEEEGVW